MKAVQKISQFFMRGCVFTPETGCKGGVLQKFHDIGRLRGHPDAMRHHVAPNALRSNRQGREQGD